VPRSRPARRLSPADASGAPSADFDDCSGHRSCTRVCIPLTATASSSRSTRWGRDPTGSVDRSRSSTKRSAGCATGPGR
jgi:hypothetical protein